MTIIFRNAVRSDADNIANLHAASWRTAYNNVLSAEYLSGNILQERSQLWNQRLSDNPDTQKVIVAEKDHQIIGFACTHLREHPQWGSLLDNLHVQPELKRNGIGRQLMAEVAKICLTHSPDCGLYLNVLKPNINAQKFYLSLGATHSDSAIWHSPDGGATPRFIFTWNNLEQLLNIANKKHHSSN